MVEADMRFTGEPEPAKTTEEKIKPRNVGFILLIPALFAPIAIAITNYPWSGVSWSMISMLYQINYYPGEGIQIYPTFYFPWGFDPMYFFSMMMSMSLFVGPRFGFTYQMVRLYKGRTTRKRALIVGFVADCFFLFLNIPYLFMPMGFMAIILPLPFVLLVALILMKIKAPAIIISPWEELDEPDKWWEKKEAAPMTAPPELQSTGVATEEKTPSKPKDGSWWEEEEKDKKPKEPTSPW
jgi:hypothetical protein